MYQKAGVLNDLISNYRAQLMKYNAITLMLMVKQQASLNLRLSLYVIFVTLGSTLLDRKNKGTLFYSRVMRE